MTVAHYTLELLPGPDAWMRTVFRVLVRAISIAPSKMHATV